MSDNRPISENISAGPATPGWAARQWIRWRPAVKQTWLNLKVRVPFLQNPADRARLATFLARERRTGLEWQVRLPEQCWSCGRTDDLREREFEVPIRSFEFPLPIVGLGSMCVAFFLFFAWAFTSPKMLVLAIVSAVITLVTVLIKSWTETVCVSMNSCSEHSREMKFPECVVDEGELYLFLPNAKLATATVAAAKAERLKKQGYTPFEGGSPASAGGGYSGGSASPHDDAGDDDRPRYRPPPPRKPVELPPIKLEGDDE